jgi:peptidoglycan/xylan/chitin deacetylase (PgdA/CDA1 family)/GT2 family glycosyltransferase/pyruvate-formate lyase-activating enzyme
MAPPGQILCLHYVAPPGPRPRRWAISPDALRAVVQRERASGRLAGSLAEAAADPTRFAVTFDDAHRSLLTEAAAVLRALDVPAAVFVPTDHVGTSDDILSWDELRALRDAGWTIGSHTRTHPRVSWRLYDEDATSHRRRLDDEMARSKELLENKLRITVRDFAFPYGETTPMAREAVACAGYERAFTVRDSLAWDGDPLSIPRLDGMEAHGLVKARSSAPTPISVVIPACDRQPMLREVLARWSAQSYPTDAFEVVVVDDGSRSSLRPCLDGAAFNVRLVEGGGEPGIFRAGVARQRGVDEARFDTLAFLDADIAVGPDFLWSLDWIHQRSPGAVVLGYLSGYNLHDIGFTHSLADLRGGPDPTSTLPIIVDRSREPTLRACFDDLDRIDEPWRLAYTGNLSVTRAALAAVGGFAREFTGWGLEDLDLGRRLQRAGAPFVFSRFALGYHLVDAGEVTPRNPFRAAGPTRALFSGYEKNLLTLSELHPNDPGVARFVQQAHADIEETCGRPDTVGVEMGGGCPLECAFHRKLHRCQPGGVPTHELLDRLAYAIKVGARALYLLGGEPADHPGFLALLRAARTAGMRLTAETTALPFSRAGQAEEAREAGLDQVVVEVLAFDAAGYDAVTRSTGRFQSFLSGLDRLGEAGISRTARLVVDADRATRVPHALGEIRARGLGLDAVVVLEGAPYGSIEQAVLAAGFKAGVLRRPPS